jgi:hypothetical protein
VDKKAGNAQGKRIQILIGKGKEGLRCRLDSCAVTRPVMEGDRRDFDAFSLRECVLVKTRAEEMV